jgi:hypothetical protein
MSDKKMFTLADFDRELYENDKINSNKRFSAFMKKVKAIAKRKTCYLCGRNTTNFCNSHSIPRFYLKNIAENGTVYSTGALTKVPFTDEELGVNKAGVFYLICEKCDAVNFSDYENPNNYLALPTPKMLSQIVMKTYLKEIHKKYSEKAIYERYEQLVSKTKFISGRLEITNIDLRDYEKRFNDIRKHLQKYPNDSAYYMCFYKKLDYVVPFAFQGKVTLISGFDNDIIHDIYDFSADTNKFEDLHICVFPLKNFSVVMLLVKEGTTKYRKFYKTLNKLDELEQLRAISYIIFLYSEEVYISKSLENVIKNNKHLIEASQKTDMMYTEIGEKQDIFAARETFSLNKRHCFPNLLSEEYQIRPSN